MSEFEVMVVSNGMHTSVMSGIYDKDEAVERAENWFKENVKGRYGAKVVVVEIVKYRVEEFIMDNPEEHEAEERDISIEDFIKEREE